jgi:hypothetical protein
MARSWFSKAAALVALALGCGCQHWCERHCPQQQCVPCCAPVQCCPAPAAAAPVPAPVSVAPARSFSNPTGCAPVCVPACVPCQ